MSDICDLDTEAVAQFGAVAGERQRALVWCRTHREYEWHDLPFAVLPREPGTGPDLRAHHMLCDYHCSQNDDECSCGATRPKASWFDTVVREHAATLARLRSVRE